MRTRVLVAFASMLLAGHASAQQGTLPTQQFAPAPGGDNNYVSVQGTGTLQQWKPAVGLYINYANQPLVLTRESTGEEVYLIEHQLSLDLIAAIGFTDFLELGLAIPVTIYQAPGDPSGTLNPSQLSTLDSFVMGDIRLYPKWSILHDPEGFGLGLLAVVTLPRVSS